MVRVQSLAQEIPYVKGKVKKKKIRKKMQFVTWTKASYVVTLIIVWILASQLKRSVVFNNLFNIIGPQFPHQ